MLFRSIRALTQGVGDFVAYSLVVTPQRQEQVAFTVPLETNAQQVLITGPNFGKVTSLDDLGGKEIYTNPLTMPYQVLQQLNDRLKKAGKPLVVIKPADKYLGEDDLVQMVNAGLLPATVIEVSRAKLWAEVLHNLTVHPDLVFASDEQTAWALRKDRKSTRLNSSHSGESRMPSSA